MYGAETHKLLAKYYEIKKDAIGGKLGFSIPVNPFEKGLCIHHYGSIVFNTEAKIGKIAI